MPEPIKGRGTSLQPANRFDQIHVEPDPEFDSSQDPKPKTIYFKDHAKTIITYNDSPDVGFNAGINPYRGCEHGCIYCFARPSHDYLGFNSGLDFETRIIVKVDAPALLRKELSSKKWQPQVLAFSGNTDCYQPVEKKLEITRNCLKVLNEFHNPVAMITKNRLIERDIDILKEMAEYNCVRVCVSVTSLDGSLARIMEPRTSQPENRLKAIEKLSQAGVPVVALVAPVIPGLNDEEIPQILKAVSECGARGAHYVMVRLPFAVKDLFENWLTNHFPEKKDKILNRIRSLRGGKLYDSKFGKRMRGDGVFADAIENLFDVYAKKYHLDQPLPGLSIEHFKRNEEQLNLF